MKVIPKVLKKNIRIEPKQYIRYFNILIFFAITCLLIWQSGFRLKPALTGDGPEYLVITTAVSRHATPDIRLADIKQSQKILYANGDSIPNSYYKGLQNFVTKKPKPLQGYWGIFTSKDGKFYGYHFWFYSMLCAPAKLLLQTFSGNPLRCFMLTNAFFIILVLVYILWFSKLNELQKTAAIIFFVTGCNTWYLYWTHPEVYSTACIFLACILLFDRRFALSILFAALGSLQNPPIAFLIPFVLLRFVSLHGFQWKQLLFFCAIGALSLLPSAFYFYNFGTPNLIMFIHATDVKYITFRRLLSLLFDINQGMILSIPFILLLFFGHSVFKFIQISGSSIKATRKKEIAKKQSISGSFNLWFPLILIAMAIPSMQQINWNMGESVIVRYATWMSMLPVSYIIYEMNWYRIRNIVVLIVLIASQIAVTQYFGGFTPEGWRYVAFYKHSRFVLNHYPCLYNPEPEIFAERVMHREEVTPDASPVFYKTPNGIVTKALVHKDYLKKLDDKLQIDNNILSKKIKNLHYRYDWAYLNFSPDLNLFEKKTSLKLDSITPVRPENIISQFIANFDTLTKNDKFILNDTILLESFNTQSNEKSLSGKYAVKLTRSNRFAITFAIKNVYTNDRFRFSIWRLSPNNTGLIVASDNTGKIFYRNNCKLIDTNQKQWIKLALDITVDTALPNNELKVYLWNNGENTVYFDNFEMIKYTIK